jgi:hypothetical protein
MKEIGRLWFNLSEEQKLNYKEIADQDKNRYRQQLD